MRRVPRASWRGGRISSGERAIPEETAVALTYNRFAYAVMMATPDDLEDFAVGFSLSERIVARPEEILDIEIVPGDNGVELRLWIAEARIDAFTEHRRYMAGPTGCGLCGVESLAEAMRPPPKVASRFSHVGRRDRRCRRRSPGLAVSEPRNPRGPCGGILGTLTAGLLRLREDVGRHNALDKLVGALARGNVPADAGAILLTSRVSVEMIQKAAVLGAPVVVAVSAPTALALRTAEDAGITLVAIARDDGFEVFSHPDRIAIEWAQHVA